MAWPMAGLGNPFAPTQADQCLAEVRACLQPKPVQEQILAACERLREDLAMEGERRETSWGPPPRRKAPASPSKQ